MKPRADVGVVGFRESRVRFLVSALSSLVCCAKIWQFMQHFAILQLLQILTCNFFQPVQLSSSTIFVFQLSNKNFR